ncbi:MAG: sulfotransferase [Planctomycetaceae bacterium]|nr:sulfotransferase [Planctomycetaceae bacterium]
MTLPNFFIIGAMKSATTSICDLLSRHPECFIVEPKEPEFFSDDKEYGKGVESYESLFSEVTSQKMIGDGSTGYSKHQLFPNAATRIHSLVPEAKLIYVCRDPVKRIESHWMHSVRCGLDPNIDFASTVSEQDSHYINVSLYWHQLQVYRALFPDTQILILFYEDFVSEPEKVLQQCYTFLGISDSYHDSTSHVPRHVSLGSRVDKPIIGRIQKLNAIRSIFSCLPRPLRNFIKRPFQHEVTSRPEWTQAALSNVLEQIVPDSKQLLTWAGKPEDFWPLRVEEYFD